jgi:putative glutamine amidotransferase
VPTAAALSLIPFAVDIGVPLFAVCRGLQEMNVAYGGSLRSVPAGSVCHREDVSRPRDEQYLPEHTVSVTPGGVLHDVLAALEVRVNSLHGQAVDALAPSLRVEAHAADQVVEAASVTGARAFALGVQWHPEWYARSDPISRRLFEAFGNACRQYQRQTCCTLFPVRKDR